MSLDEKIKFSLFTNEKEARQPSGSMQGREGRLMVVLLGRHSQQVRSRSRYAKLSRTNDAFTHGGQALAVADPVHQLNSFLWIVKLRLRFFDSSILEHWALQFSSYVIAVFFLGSPHPSHFFSSGLLFGCKSLFDCLFFPSSHFQAIHSFSSSRGIVKSAFVFYIELVKSSCFV
jgi:hypothetical protein